MPPDHFGVWRFSAALDRATCNPRSSFAILLLLLPLLLIAAAPPEAVKPAERQQNMARVNSGMTAVEGRKLLGPADHTSRQILYRRYVEQWNYDNPPGLWIELDCVKGQHPRVIGVHLPASEK
jgi:hypothetical protein